MGNNSRNEQLLDLEQRYWQAIKDRDTAAASQLTSDPCVIAGAQGVASIDQKAFASMMEDTSWELHDFTLSDIQVERPRDDVAIVAYKVKEEMTVNGKPLTLEAADTSTWIRQNGDWVCALHTESLIGDPFGRDRQPNNSHQ